jgi:hypothetical protein
MKSRPNIPPFAVDIPERWPCGFLTFYSWLLLTFQTFEGFPDFLMSIVLPTTINVSTVTSSHLVREQVTTEAEVSGQDYAAVSSLPQHG